MPGSTPGCRLTAVRVLGIERSPGDHPGMDNRLRNVVRPNAGPLIGHDRVRAAIDAHYRWLDQLVVEALKAPPKPERLPDTEEPP